MNDEVGVEGRVDETVLVRFDGCVSKGIPVPVFVTVLVDVCVINGAAVDVGVAEKVLLELDEGVSKGVPVDVLVVVLVKKRSSMWLQ